MKRTHAQQRRYNKLREGIIMPITRRNVSQIVYFFTDCVAVTVPVSRCRCPCAVTSSVVGVSSMFLSVLMLIECDVLKVMY